MMGFESAAHHVVHDFYIACANRSLKGPSQFELDRNTCGSHYGSGNPFRFLGKHPVNDFIHLHVKIHEEKPRL